MASLNQCSFIGNLGKDPETRYMTNGDAVTNFNVACTETWKDKNGEKQERTEWVRIVTFGKLAEICGEYLKKGKQVFVQGRMQTRKWEDKEGVERYSTEIVADTMKMLGNKGDAGNGSESAPAPSPARQEKPAAAKPAPAKKPSDDLDDDIPF